MEIISLLILAAVAGFLFYQLRSALGQVPENKNIQAKKTEKGTSLKERFVSKKADILNLNSEADKDYNHLIQPTQGITQDDILKVIHNIKTRYTGFDVHKFIEGAKGAYDMILESFNQGLPESVKDYISKDIYNSYRKLLEDYKQKNYKYETIVTRIDKAVITSAETNEISARITVEINAYNISVLRDDAGKIIQGDPDNVLEVKDIWTFERLYSVSNSAWVVIAVS